METTDENVNDYPFLKLVCDETKHLQKEFSAELNNFLKNEINEDSFYKKLKEKTHKLEKDNEAYIDSMRTFQLEYEKLSAQFQEDARLRPKVLNQVEATREILMHVQERLMKIRTLQLGIQEDTTELCEIYKRASEEFENDICEMNRLKNRYETIYTAEKEANKALLEQLEKRREMLCVMKQDSDNFILELLSKCENSEINNKETALKNIELQVMVATLRWEMQKKEEDITRIKENKNAMEQRSIEMEKRIQDAERALQKSNECMTFVTTNLMTTEEKIRNVQEQLFYAIKEKDCSDKSTKLTSEQLFTLEEKFKTSENKLNDANEIIVMLLLESQELDSEIKKSKQRIAELNVLETELNEKNNIIKDIKDKYNMKVNEKKELLAITCDYKIKIEELTKTLESEREKVSASASMISQMKSTSKEEEEALSETQRLVTVIQEDLARTSQLLSSNAKMETSKKVGSDNRVSSPFKEKMK